MLSSEIFIIQELCAKGSTILQTKSLVVEEAATELIGMLLHIEERDEPVLDDDKRDGTEHVYCARLTERWSNVKHMYKYFNV